MTWKCFLHYWCFVLGIHLRWPLVDSLHKEPVVGSCDVFFIGVMVVGYGWCNIVYIIFAFLCSTIISNIYDWCNEMNTNAVQYLVTCLIIHIHNSVVHIYIYQLSLTLINIYHECYVVKFNLHVDRLVQERRNSIAFLLSYVFLALTHRCDMLVQLFGLLTKNSSETEAKMLSFWWNSRHWH